MTERARVVVGSSFGDEGKGLMTDFLCAQGSGMVIRFNGSAQAGHTVVTPEGERHVFKHFGSGTFLDVPTYLSDCFIVNPIMFFIEIAKLNKLGIRPIVYAHPNCIITTHADMLINQELESVRGADRHGSVGVGVSETIERHIALPNLTITMSDIWNGSKATKKKLTEICGKYYSFRTKGKKLDKPDMFDKFLEGLETIGDRIHPLGIAQCKTLDPVFEGAQGLLLDQDNKEFFPHVTRSYTGMKNVRILCEQAGIDNIEAYYVSRTYLTRHGAGPLPGENPRMSFEDKTNAENEWQGKLRFAKLDTDKLQQRIFNDFGSKPKLVLTHCDQLQPPDELTAELYGYGETRNDIRTTLK